jgi:hypothetical protein
VSAHPTAIILSAIALALPLCACDDIRAALETSELEQRLRDDPDRPGKVGSIVAVSVHQHARTVADAIDSRPDPRCAIVVRAGQTWVLEQRLERRRGDTVIAWWEETRRFSIDADGEMDVALDANFRTQIGEKAARRMQWRIAQDRSFVAESQGAALRWYARAPEDDEEARLWRAGPGAFQALLDAVDGWEPTSNDSWQHGDEPLRCVHVDEGHAFVDRFLAAARTEEASLRADERSWTFSASWQLPDQTTMRARASARVEPVAEDVSAPEDVVDVSRDRSFARSGTLLEKLAKDGLVELTSDTRPSEDEE